MLAMRFAPGDLIAPHWIRSFSLSAYPLQRVRDRIIYLISALLGLAFLSPGLRCLADIALGFLSTDLRRVLLPRFTVAFAIAAASINNK